MSYRRSSPDLPTTVRPRNRGHEWSSRRGTGLRNRHRPKRAGSYKRKDKASTSDFYGHWKNGVRETPERIARRYE